jgi:hypothetical protein
MGAKTAAPHRLAGFSAKRVGVVTIFEIRGTATPADLVTIFRGFVDHPTPLVLWDMREYTVSSLGDDELRGLVGQLVRIDRQQRVHGRWAFVCPRDADHFVMRMLIRYADANNYGIHLEVFRGLDDARCWLAEV